RLAAQHMHEGTKSSNAIHVAMQQRRICTKHPRPQLEGRGASRSTALSITSHFPEGLALRPTLTVRHGAHQPLPSECSQQAASSHPRAIATGNTSNRRRGTSVHLAERKGKWRHANSTASRGTINKTL
ncbi:hypothetical protein TcG_11921, partial [Trypanosoma cruzi]